MISKIEDDTFEIEAVWNAAQFARSLLNIAEYVQIKFNSDLQKPLEQCSTQCLATLRQLKLSMSRMNQGYCQTLSWIIWKYLC